MSDDLRLTLEAKCAIEADVREMDSSWLKWIGVANAAALIGMLSYVVTELPDVAAERLVPGFKDRMANLQAGLEKSMVRFLRFRVNWTSSK